MNVTVSKKRFVRLGVILALAACPLLAGAQEFPKLSRSDLRTLQDSFADLADQVLPSVVSIRTYAGGDGRGDRSVLRSLSQGAGVIYRPNGFVLTNYHVVENATHVLVVLHNGMEYDATIIQFDARSDLAVVKIDADRLQAARFGDLKKLRVGHWTFAIGNPFGLANFTGKTSFTVGNISSFGRNLTDLLDRTDNRYYGNLIETSAAINPGNSGGPLFNIDGEVIGIVTAIETHSGVTQGMGFAIPITDRTRAIIRKLERGEEVRYGYLGVKVDKRLLKRWHTVRGLRVRGALMGEVLDGPAARAGLRDGDVVIEFDGIAIHDYDHLVRVVGGTPVGTAVAARYVRSGKEKNAVVVLGDRPIDSREEVMLADGSHVPTTNWRGALFAEVTHPLRRKLGIDADKRGILVVQVRPGSDAAVRGLQADQIVVAVNGKPVRTLKQFRDARALAEDAIRLHLQSDTVIGFELP